ncbi:hypothetical protein JXB11_00475 [Candidatus Woesearchaeota archaeon]|nr:hypothetical protein [Candidatus Woesearchaeota archaeon]
MADANVKANFNADSKTLSFELAGAVWVNHGWEMDKNIEGRVLNAFNEELDRTGLRGENITLMMPDSPGAVSPEFGCSAGLAKRFGKYFVLVNPETGKGPYEEIIHKALLYLKGQIENNYHSLVQ